MTLAEEEAEINEDFVVCSSSSGGGSSNRETSRLIVAMMLMTRSGLNLHTRFKSGIGLISSQMDFFLFGQAKQNKPVNIIQLGVFSLTGSDPNGFLCYQQSARDYTIYLLGYLHMYYKQLIVVVVGSLGDDNGDHQRKNFTMPREFIRLNHCTLSSTSCKNEE